MKKLNWRVKLGIGLVLLSAGLYFIHWLIYREAKHIFIYLLGDIAFIPIEVLIVTLIIHALLVAREKQAMLKKMNMVIGSFYSEVGTQLLRDFARFDPEAERVAAELRVTGTWTDGQFNAARARIKGFDYTLRAERGDLEALRDFLVGKRTFLLGLLQNPNLLEHEAFTDLLWAVFHLTEELASRSNLSQLSDADRAHLEGDLKRAYTCLVAEWVDYMRHLKGEYPYLFSLALRTNPFDPAARPEVK
jgi:hypothetical protein